MSGFGYKDAKGQIVKVPVRYGDMSRQVGQILKKNSENTIPSAPFIACYIKDFQYDRSRVQDPTFVSKVQIRERALDDTGAEYINQEGANYTVERIMPVPYILTFAADIWTTNTQQKLQLVEQLTVLFNPSLEIQTTDNYIDWTSLSLLELSSQSWSSRTVPTGLEQDIDICNLTFTAPVWITPPAKVKRMGIITKIITNIFAVSEGSILTDYSDPNAAEIFGVADAQVIVTPGNFDLLVLNNIASLIGHLTREDESDTAFPANTSSWYKLLDLYPGQFRAGLSQLRLTKPDGNEIVAYISIDPLDETRMALNFDGDTIPANSIISGRGTVDAIIDPETYNPRGVVTNTRYLILESINVNPLFGTLGYDGPDAWKNSNGTDFQAYANDIITWNGSQWSVLFSAASTTTVTYITNSYTGVQYKWSAGEWSKSFEGVYSQKMWRLIL